MNSFLTSWDQSVALFWTQKLVAIALLQQTLEYWSLRRYFSEDGIWTWKTVSDDWSPLIRYPLSAVLGDRTFPFFLLLQFCSALALLVSVDFASVHFALMLCFATTLLIAARFRGTFNGGSDYMTSALLAALTLCSIAPRCAKLALTYIAVQSLLSYTVAGWSKLKFRGWRNGEQLRVILTASNYPVPKGLANMVERQSATRLTILSVIVLVFECSFPLALYGPRTCLAFLAAALSFQIAFAVVFGLNRFWLAWLASYPALFYGSLYFSLWFSF